MTQLKITGMTCDSCATHVRQALEKVPGVQSARVSYAQGTAEVALAPDTAADALIAAVGALGYRARLDEGSTPPPSAAARATRTASS